MKERSHEQTGDQAKIGVVDLGSNSYHMVIYSYRGGVLSPLSRVRHCVQLAKYLDDTDHITAKGLEVSEEALTDFANVLNQFELDKLRAVGTSTLRIGKNRDLIQKQVYSLLSIPLDVISGEEEGRLIYQGAVLDRPESQQCLIVDIGGGSTEIILGKGPHIETLHSLKIGCVNLAQRASDFASQVAIAKKMLEQIRQNYQTSFDICCGCSGTIRALIEVVYACGMAKNGVTYQEITEIKNYLLAGKSVLDLPGIRHNREDSFQSGVALLLAIFDIFSIEQMELSTGGLREGVCAELIASLNLPGIHTKRL